jgi:predicted lipoprotein with Yx(FWY)xxD motif
MRTSHSRPFLIPATLIVGVLALAACGSDDKTSTESSSSSSSSSTTTTTAAAPGVVKEADVGSVGNVLVTADGRTVYTLTKDGAAVDCTGGCLSAWPPVVLPPGTDTATGASNLGVVTIAAGKQVTSNGLPIYTFVQDTAAGDAKGEGLQSFGGTWNVVKVSGGAASSGTSSTPSTPSTTTGSGSGY